MESGWVKLIVWVLILWQKVSLSFFLRFNSDHNTVNNLVDFSTFHHCCCLPLKCWIDHHRHLCQVVWMSDTIYCNEVIPKDYKVGTKGFNFHQNIVYISVFIIVVVYQRSAKSMVIVMFVELFEWWIQYTVMKLSSMMTKLGPKAPKEEISKPSGTKERTWKFRNKRNCEKIVSEGEFLMKYCIL